MHLVPFHTFRFAPPLTPPVDAASLVQLLSDPVVRMEPLTDAIGVPYAYDLAFTNGLYVLLISAVLLRALRGLVIDEIGW